jgi:hypothetical protein
MGFHRRVSSRAGVRQSPACDGRLKAALAGLLDLENKRQYVFLKIHLNFL